MQPVQHTPPTQFPPGQDTLVGLLVTWHEPV